MQRRELPGNGGEEVGEQEERSKSKRTAKSKRQAASARPSGDLIDKVGNRLAIFATDVALTLDSTLDYALDQLATPTDQSSPNGDDDDDPSSSPNSFSFSSTSSLAVQPSSPSSFLAIDRSNRSRFTYGLTPAATDSLPLQEVWSRIAKKWTTSMRKTPSLIISSTAMLLVRSLALFLSRLLTWSSFAGAIPKPVCAAIIAAAFFAGKGTGKRNAVLAIGVLRIGAERVDARRRKVIMVKKQKKKMMKS